MNLPELGDSLFWNLPRWHGQSPFYEVYFLKLNAKRSVQDEAIDAWGTSRPSALWIRYTLTAPARASPIGEVWAFIFCADAPARSRGAKWAAPISTVRWCKGFPIRIGDAGELTHTTASGSLIVDGQPLQWALQWEPGDSAVGLFPMRWMYRTRFPRTKYVSPHWNVRVSGTLSWGEHCWQVREAPAQQAHIWGTRYAERWIWTHCNAFDKAPDAVFEGLEVQVRFGRWLTPPLRMLYLRTAETCFFTHRWRTLVPQQNVAQQVGSWRFEAIEGDWRLVGECHAHPDQILGACYTDPDGSHRWCHNTKIGRATLQLAKWSGDHWQIVLSLQARDTCAIEWVEPVPDARIERWV